MTQRTLIFLALLAAVGAVVYLLMGSGTPPAPVPTLPEVRRGDPEPRTPQTPRTAEADASTSPGAAATGTARPATEGASSVIGLRVPEGVDLSDPAQVRSLLAERLAESPVDWNQVARLVGLLNEPLDATTRARLLKELVDGRRGLVLKVFQEANDGTLVPELLAKLDGDLSGSARSAVLTALATLPGADPAEVVKGLEARLTGNTRKDVVVLRAIGERGGVEAARAITTYIADSRDPMAVASRGTLQLDLKDDPAAAAVLAEALKQTRSDEALNALIRVATQPGAEGVVESLVALDSSSVAPKTRNAALRALAVIGTEKAVDHVLLAAEGGDDTALAAVKSLGVMTAADEGARNKLMASLEARPSGTFAEERRRETLRALSNLRHVPAIPAFAAALGDADPQVQLIGVQGLGRVGESGRPHVDALVDTFGKGSENVQRAVVISLGQIGGRNAEGVLRQLESREDLPLTVQRALRAALARASRAGADDDEDRDDRLGGR